jgi:2-amino-4-hydroxy-6-hydroxymethyldihydropteridine diphosphokinase
MTSFPVTCYVGLGANLGEARDHVRHALQRLAELPQSRMTGQSDLFRTAPLDADGDDYINAVARLDTSLEAEELLTALQRIEQDFGRERSYRNAPRTLDLDLLLYGQKRIASPVLDVPHPRMTERAFVLIPLLQLDPLLSIPGKGPVHSFVPGVAAQVIQKI